jgi:2-keto-4-pentenoate hydratase
VSAMPPEVQVKADLAVALLRARRERAPIPPLSAAHPWLDLDDAYDIQSHQVDRWLHEGDAVVGYKVGLVSPAMRHQMGVGEPDFGRVMGSWVRPSGIPLDPAAHISPMAEPELGFVLARPLKGPGVTAGDVLSATAALVPLLEVVDSRVADWELTIIDTVADNASSGAVRLGVARHQPDARRLGDVDCRLSVDGIEHARGAGADVCGHPAEAVAWLVNELGRRGVGVRSGQLVLSGSITRAVPVREGQSVEATFGDLGSVRLDVGPASSDTPRPGGKR